MSLKQTEKTEIRNYLLGNTASTEEKFEERLMTDDKFFKELEIQEEELIQDYVDENLSNTEKEKFETHFLISKERQEKVSFAKSLRNHIDQKEIKLEPKAKTLKSEKPKQTSFFSSLFSSPIPVAACLLIIAALSGYIIYNNFQTQSDNEIALASLNRAFKNERPLESRISGFDYAPKRNTRGDDDSNINKLALEMARDKIKKNADDNPNTEDLYLLGKFYLTQKEFDKAIEALEQAVKDNPNSAEFHNDLGVAYLEKGKLLKEQKIELLAKANEHINEAIEIDNSFLDAHYNLGLVRESLSSIEQAIKAWKKYLELDQSSKWANEAQEHIDKLENSKPISRTNEDILEDFLQAKENGNKKKAWQVLSSNREKITGKLIPQQLTFAIVDAKLGDDRIRVEKLLDSLRYLGELETEQSGEKFWQELAQFYSNVSVEKNTQLKVAQDLLKEGYQICLKGKYKESLDVFEKAKFFFLKAGSKLDANLVDLMITYCKTRSGQIRESTINLQTLKAISEKNSYKWINTQSLLWLGINANSTKQFSTALNYLKKALSYANEIEDLYLKEQILSTLSSNYFLLSQFKKSLSYTEKNLELSRSKDVSLRQKWRDFYAAGNLFFQMNFYHTALLFEFEALSIAQNQLDEKTFDYSNFVNIGLIYGKMNNLDKAYEFIERGKRIAETFTDEQLKKKCFAYTNLKLGHLKRQEKKYGESAEHYNNAISFYDSDEFQVDSYEAHKGLVLNYLAQGSDDSLREELPKIISIFNEYRTKINEEQSRNSFFDNEQGIYDIAIDFEIRNSNFTKAFEYAEESRSRTLFELQNAAIKQSIRDGKTKLNRLTDPLKLVQIQAEMSENAQLVEYAVLSEQVIIWSVTKSNVVTKSHEISIEALRKLVSDYLEKITENKESNETIKLSKQLYEILIAPIQEQLGRDKNIFLIPDKFLFHLPFATLYSDRYLIEEHILSYSPSANVFLNSSKRASEFSTNESEDLLAIGNPNFNASNYENELQLLPYAEEEATKIAKLYNEPIVLTGQDATKVRIKENIIDSDVIHFAGHYLVDKKSSLNSSLILAGENKKDAELTNLEIFNQEFSNTKLIILSACQTGAEKYYNGEGMIGATRTFLAKGIPLVVASQWEVDSEATKELMILFHKNRTNLKLPTAKALQKAQIEMLKDTKFKRPYYWAAFASIGGYSSI